MRHKGELLVRGVRFGEMRRRIVWGGLALPLLLLAGCVIESPLALRKFWADYNTLNSPAVFYDKISHMPPSSAQVKELRWMYNMGPHEVGPHSLIPPPVGVAPLPSRDRAQPERTFQSKPERTFDSEPSGKGNGSVPEPNDGPLLPPLPKSGAAPTPKPPPRKALPVPPPADSSGRGDVRGPVAVETNTLPKRTAGAEGLWRFVR